MLKSLKSGLKSEHGNAILLAGLIGLVVSDILPTPADAAYFSLERSLRDKWKKGQITPKDYWRKSSFYYYSLNPIYWTLVSILILSLKGTSEQKIKILGGIIGGGAALAIIYKNIQKDTAELKSEEEQRKALLDKFPDIAPILDSPQFKNYAAELSKK